MIHYWRLLKHKQKEKTPAVHTKDTQFLFLFETVLLDLLDTVLKVYGRSFNMEVDNNQNSG